MAIQYSFPKWGTCRLLRLIWGNVTAKSKTPVWSYIQWYAAMWAPLSYNVDGDIYMLRVIHHCGRRRESKKYCERVGLLFWNISNMKNISIKKITAKIKFKIYYFHNSTHIDLGDWNAAGVICPVIWLILGNTWNHLCWVTFDSNNKQNVECYEPIYQHNSCYIKIGHVISAAIYTKSRHNANRPGPAAS